ncbi:MAG: hypothetical protein AABX14_03865 [Candidatus Aenigmatarchaeota archaeon]
MEKKHKYHEILSKSEISLRVDSYNDIFSSFDPRPYSQKSLSVDFISEAKRAARDKTSGSLELKLLMEKKKRSAVHEKMIKKRMRNHFMRHRDMLLKEKKSMIRTGVSFIVSGILLMFIATLILFGGETTLLATFMIVLLEPGGWFLFWEGLNQIVFEVKKINPDLKFYNKMTKCRIEFLSY